MSQKPPGPKGFELFQNLTKLGKDPLGVIEKLRDKFGDFIGVNIFGRNIVIVSHPNYIQHIMKDNFKNYFRRGQDFEEVRPIIGNGLLLSDGEVWRQQRRTLSREFHTDSVEKFIPDIIKVTEIAMEKWLFEKQGKVKMYDEFMHLTLEIAALLFMGTHIDNAKVFHDAIEFSGHLAEARIRSGIRVPRGCPLPSHIKANKKIKAMDDIIFKIISDYKSSSNEKKNVLSRLINANVTSYSMSDQQLRDEVVTMLLAGHETTASALSWVFYNLAKYPEWQEIIHKEVTENLQGDSMSIASIEKLVHTKAFIQESLRLYPTVANMDRQATEDDIVGGYKIKKKSTVNISVYLVHRHPEFWPEPLKFDPKRFLKGCLDTIHPFAYIPFGKGPRACIGELLAMVETQAVVALVVKKMKFSMISSEPVKILPRITIIPEGGLPMKLERRKA